MQTTYTVQQLTDLLVTAAMDFLALEAKCGRLEARIEELLDPAGCARRRREMQLLCRKYASLL